MNDPCYKRDFGMKTCEECGGDGWDNGYDLQCGNCFGFGEIEMTEEEHLEWVESKREELREGN